MPSPEHNKAEIVRRTGHTLSTISRLIDNHDIISFDVFGTLLARYALSVVDVYGYLEKQFDVVGFCSARQKAEQLARRRFGSDEAPEVSLEEIYEVLSVLFPGHGVKPGDELLAEEKFSYADSAIVLILEIARQKDKRVIGLSDSYLSKIQTTRLLKANGIELDEQYTSCDYRREGLGKFNGRIFSFMTKEEGTAPHRVLHFGADLVADVENALACDILAVHVKPLPDCLQQDDIPFSNTGIGEDSLTTSLIRGHIAARLPHVDPEEADLYTYGFNMGGPLLLGFCNYISECANQDDVDRILLPQRAGYIIERAIDILQLPVPEVSILEVTGFSHEALLEAPTADHAQLRDNINSWFDQDHQSVAIVDVDWDLNASNVFEKLISERVHGYRLGIKTNTSATREASGYLFGGPMTADYEATLVQCAELVELLFSRPTSGIFTVRTETGELAPANVNVISAVQIRNLAMQTVQRGALDFLSLVYSRVDALDAEELADYNRLCFSRLISAPTKREYSAFEGVPHSLHPDLGTWRSIGHFWNADRTSDQSLADLQNNHLQQLRNYDLLLPDAVKRLSLRDDIDQMDWRRTMFRHPMKVSYWNSIRRYLRRKN
ncbi:hypothetical protein [uncultured Ruegeria sp.]|uniref:hypothetical protein n=1 Tax=uncultured Ruegeria sp. TaxID=259304 RepID=UPI00262B2600|nr:hypothetical protein [uncultured Ruegeria sp.]